jgi:Ca-activated chloride channel homolog
MQAKKYILFLVVILIPVLVTGILSVPGFFAWLGHREFADEQYEQAITQYERSLASRIVGNKSDDYFNIASVYYKQQKYEEAIEYYLKALEAAQTPEQQEKILYNIGNAYVYYSLTLTEEEVTKKIAELQKAIQKYTDALDIDPDNLLASHNRRIAMDMLKELEQIDEAPEEEESQQEEQEAETEEAEESVAQQEEYEQENKSEYNERKHGDEGFPETQIGKEIW